MEAKTNKVTIKEHVNSKLMTSEVVSGDGEATQETDFSNPYSPSPSPPVPTVEFRLHHLWPGIFQPVTLVLLPSFAFSKAFSVRFF